MRLQPSVLWIALCRPLQHLGLLLVPHWVGPTAVRSAGTTSLVASSSLGTTSSCTYHFVLAIDLSGKLMRFCGWWALFLTFICNHQTFYAAVIEEETGESSTGLVFVSQGLREPYQDRSLSDSNHSCRPPFSRSSFSADHQRHGGQPMAVWILPKDCEGIGEQLFPLRSQLGRCQPQLCSSAEKPIQEETECSMARWMELLWPRTRRFFLESTAEDTTRWPTASRSREEGTGTRTWWTERAACPATTKQRWERTGSFIGGICCSPRCWQGTATGTTMACLQSASTSLASHATTFSATSGRPSHSKSKR